MKAVVAAFNQEKALVGAFSVITNLRMELFQALRVLVASMLPPVAAPPAWLSSDQLSDRILCRAARRRFLRGGKVSIVWQDFNQQGGVCWPGWPPCPGHEISWEILTVIEDHFSVSRPLPSASQPASHAVLDTHHQWFKSGKTDFMFYGEIECLFAVFALATLLFSHSQSLYPTQIIYTISR